MPRARKTSPKKSAGEAEVEATPAPEAAAPSGKLELRGWLRLAEDQMTAWQASRIGEGQLPIAELFDELSGAVGRANLERSRTRVSFAGAVTDALAARFWSLLETAWRAAAPLGAEGELQLADESVGCTVSVAKGRVEAYEGPPRPLPAAKTAQPAPAPPADATSPAEPDDAPPKAESLKGLRVRVVASKKEPVGLEGEVVWHGPSKFGPGMRVGVKDASGKVHWFDAEEVEPA